MVMQMYGLFCYSLVNMLQRKKILEMATFANRANLNDFLHDNLLYLANYVWPTLLATPKLKSNSMPSNDINEDATPKQREVTGD